MSAFATLIFVALALLSKCQADLIGNFCSKSNNPSLCSNALRSDPQSKGADARGLGKIAIEKAKEATQATISVAKSVSNKGNQRIISTCVQQFNSAVYNLNECAPLLNKRDRSSIATLRAKGSAALDQIDCSDDYPGQPPKLKQASAKSYTFVQLLLIIANTL